MRANNDQGKVIDTLIKARKELVSPKEHKTLTKDMIILYEFLISNSKGGTQTDNLISNAKEDLYKRFLVPRQILF